MMIDVSWIAIRLAACLLASMSLFAGAASAADPATGERIATRWCASCHAIGRGQPRTRTEAASFAEIARVPEFNARLLAFFLLDPHPKMPDMSLTRTEAADLAALSFRSGIRPVTSRAAGWCDRGRGAVASERGAAEATTAG